MAVRLGGGAGLHGQVAAGARLGFHHHRLAGHRGDAGTDDAGERIRRAAGGEGGDDAQGALLGMRRGRKQQRGRGEQGSAAGHGRFLRRRCCAARQAKGRCGAPACGRPASEVLRISVAGHQPLSSAAVAPASAAGHPVGVAGGTLARIAPGPAHGILSGSWSCEHLRPVGICPIACARRRGASARTGRAWCSPVPPGRAAAPGRSLTVPRQRSRCAGSRRRRASRRRPGIHVPGGG